MSGMGIFVALVFLAVFLLAQGLAVPVFGESRKARKRLLARLNAVSAASATGRLKTLLREKYLKELTPLEQSLEALPGMEPLRELMEQSGKSGPAYRVALVSLAFGVGGCVLGWMLTRLWYAALLLGVLALAAPLLKMLSDRARRIAKFEEQLPEALDVVKRALKAGHPFVQCLKLVAEDMDQPIAGEFDSVFAEINYGSDLRAALLGLLEKTPSVSAMAFVTAVLVQKETGGNLAETLDRISAVIRGRFKLQRQIRTLSAEGRLSAWVLSLVPLALFAVISLTTPTYLPTLLKDPKGPPMIVAACVLAVLGMLWIRRIVRIRV
ncbi:MAG TPA: type II secretion system F family protein [Steroidobacteraceae bacterium]|nr:type II secretion system F family protein [Steroidobacteraceae bacterium]